MILISEGPAKGLSIFCSFKNYNNPLPVNSTNMNINLGRSNQNVFALQTNQLTTTSSQYLPQQQLQPPYPLLATNSSPAMISPSRMSFVSFPPIPSLHPPPAHINLTVNGRQQSHSQPTVTHNHVVFLLIFGLVRAFFQLETRPKRFSINLCRPYYLCSTHIHVIFKVFRLQLNLPFLLKRGLVNLTIRLVASTNSAPKFWR